MKVFDITLLADSHMSDSYFQNVLILVNLEFEVLTMRNPAQNQDIDSSKKENLKKKSKKKKNLI